MIYLIIKTGVYRHDIAGAFLDPEDAKLHAKALADTCVDSYHDYVVQPIPINELIKSSSENKNHWYIGHSFDEPEELIKFNKGK